MNWKIVAGAISLGALMGLALLAGGILLPTASAGAPTTQLAQTAQANPTAVPTTTTPQPGVPGGPAGPHERGFGGPGFGGRGFEHGGGPMGGFETADGASRVISGTTNMISLVKGDLTYATGKMDTGTVQDWLNKADGLLKAAQTASANNEYGKAIATANAAGSLARAADMLMQQALGADKLPSYNQRPFPGKDHPGFPGAPGNGTAPTLTQAQLSRELSDLYNEIIMKAALLKSTSNAGDANTYLTTAQNYYKTAYTAYQAGNYNDAHAAASVGRTLLGVTNDLLRAATAPNSADAPVLVPAPNF